jgi:hypothetical protein
MPSLRRGLKLWREGERFHASKFSLKAGFKERNRRPIMAETFRIVAADRPTKNAASLAHIMRWGSGVLFRS